jgi:uncharacterized membrane protein YfcA
VRARLAGGTRASSDCVRRSYAVTGGPASGTLGHDVMPTELTAGLSQAALLFVVAVVGGALNSLAGGGSFLTFPALILTGVPSVNANATNTVALWPSGLAILSVYRRELRAVPYRLLLLVPSVLGGWLGAVVLLRTPSTTFERLVPYLLLGATLLFAFSGPIAARLGTVSADAGPSWRVRVVVAVLQLVIAVYGGFFGGGIGILMLGTLSLMGVRNVHQLNALRMTLSLCINGVAVVTFVLAQAVLWPQAVVMCLGAIVGGYAGATGVRRLSPRVVRGLVIAVGLGMALYFFVRG